METKSRNLSKRELWKLHGMKRVNKLISKGLLKPREYKTVVVEGKEYQRPYYSEQECLTLIS